MQANRKVVNQRDLEKAAELINSADKICITSHRSPDGDAIGSSLAMYHFLKGIGKENVQVILPNEYPDYIAWLEGEELILNYEKQSKEARQVIREADLIFSLDYNNLSRTFGMQSALEKSNAPFILIDHHQQPDDFPTVSFSDTSSCSTTQLVYDFIEGLGHEHLIKGVIAEAIYLGIVTDSGSFRFDSVLPKTHEIVAKLIASGLDHSEIHRKVYDTNRLDRLKLLGFCLNEKLKVLQGGTVAIITLTMEELERYNFRPGDTEGVVHYALSIDGVVLAVFAREGTNQIKLSFRSQRGFNVNQMARQHFNGGGHKNASGGSSRRPFNQVVEKFKDLVRGMYKEQLTK